MVSSIKGTQDIGQRFSSYMYYPRVASPDAERVSPHVIFGYLENQTNLNIVGNIIPLNVCVPMCPISQRWVTVQDKYLTLLRA